MKHHLEILTILCLSFLLYVACSDSGEKLANGYTEEQNATNLDSAAYARLMTWEPKVALKIVKVDDAEFGMPWYDVQFTTTGESSYENAGKTVDEACSVTLYAEQNGARMKLTRIYKKDVYTEFLDRDSLDAVVEDHLDNSYMGENAIANCQADSSAFVDYCTENEGTIADLFNLGKCSVLHLTCVQKFRPELTAGEYLQATAKKMKDRCIAEFYAPEESSSSGNPGSSSSDISASSSSGISTSSSSNSFKPYEGEKNGWQYLNSDIEYGIFTDDRDGQEYKTVKVGDQVWMAENLNIEYMPGEQSWCGGGSEETEGDCSVYGRLYTWEAATTEACPEGWHLPSNTEWSSFLNSEDVGGTSTAGKNLRANAPLWDPYESATNADVVGFSALPAGAVTTGYLGTSSGKYESVGITANFWSSTVADENRAYYYYMNFYTDASFQDFAYKTFGHSVRCVED